MSSVQEVLIRLEKAWREARVASHGGTVTEFALCCSFEEHSEGEVARGDELPQGLSELWSCCSEARLFEDTKFGQWGMVLHGPGESARLTKKFFEERGSNALEGDRIVGEFLGDSDLLLVRGDPKADDFGKVMVVGPLDPRAEWTTVGNRLVDVLERFAEEEGAKYWEQFRQGHR